MNSYPARRVTCRDSVVLMAFIVCQNRPLVCTLVLISNLSSVPSMGPRFYLDKLINALAVPVQAFCPWLISEWISKQARACCATLGSLAHGAFQPLQLSITSHGASCSLQTLRTHADY